MKRLLIAIVAVGALAGCGSTEAETIIIQKDVDGKTVTCVVYDGYKSGGIDCNWEAYNR